MLRFNTFRAKRYLRTKFVEGKYLLASEATDLELEITDLFRQTVRDTIGDVALADAWKVTKLSDTQLLVAPGEAWFKGLPFNFRSGKDQLVSGAIVSLGVVPVGVTVADNANGLGKVLTFNDGAVTPTNLYKISITAKEELITEVEDPFLQNANLTEPTAQKLRLNFQINIVPDSLQTETPIPYRDESSTSLSVTNYPNTGGFAAPNLVNQITVTPTAAGNGELIAIQVISGSEKIDGRDLELILRNDSAIGGGHPIPKGLAEQAAFANSMLIDSNGTKFYVNAIFNDTVSTQVVIRIDKEPNQPNPEIINTKPFTLIKRDVYVADDVNGLPQGKLFWNIATVNWHETNLLVHESVVVDLRRSVATLGEYEIHNDTKGSLRLADGGDIVWDEPNDMLSWTAPFTLINPYGLQNTIATGQAPILEGGALAYTLKLSTGGAIEKGPLAINVTAFGATSTLSAVSLSSVNIGNAVIDSAGTVAEITAIDDVNNTITTSPALTANGAGNIYRDSYGPGKVPLTKETYILAVRKNNQAYVGGSFVVSGDITWKDPVSTFSALPTVGNYDGDVRLTLDSRVPYSWFAATSTWTPLPGIEEVKATYLNPLNTTLPTGTSVIIDGQSGVDGDTVLFTNLSSNNNRIYRLGGVGVSITWTALQAFAGNLDPSDGDSVRIKAGTSFRDQLAVFTGTRFEVNDTMRFFDGISANFWELSSIKSKSISNNTTENLFVVTAAGSENLVISYSLLRGSAKETGHIYVTHNGTTAMCTKGNTFIGSSGVSFNAVISGANLEVSYTSDNSGASAPDAIKYYVSRWSDAPGGPSGIPSYSGGGGSIPAAGSNMDIQYNSGGNLAGDSRWQWDSSLGAVRMNGLQYAVLSSGLTINDNEPSPLALFSFAAATFPAAIVEYSIVRGSDYRTGRILIANDGTSVAYNDDYVETAPTGVILSAAMNGANVEIQYTSTNTGNSGTLKYTIKRWS